MRTMITPVWVPGDAIACICGARPASQITHNPLARTIDTNRYALRCFTKHCRFDGAAAIVEESPEAAVEAWNARIRATPEWQEANKPTEKPKQYHLLTIQQADGVFRNVCCDEHPADELLGLYAAGVRVLLLYALPITKEQYDRFMLDANPPEPPSVEVQPPEGDSP